MNFAKYASIHARHLPYKVCLVERTPSQNQRRTLTWKEFNDSINRVANYLSKELAVTEGDIVMHFQKNSLEWLITYFAIIKIGAIVAPLNFRFVEADILYAAEVSNPVLLIFDSEFSPIVKNIRGKLPSIKNYICIGDTHGEDVIDYQTVASYSDDTEALVDVDDHNGLAMMFTSGTTGKPKPVLHSHYSLNNTAVGNGLSYFVQKDDNYVFFLPLYHSGSLFLWAGFYATGATGILLKEFKEPRWIIEAMAEEKGTDIVFVVPIAIALLNAIKNGDVKLEDYDLSSWKYVEIGAQPVPFDVIKSMTDKLPGAVSNIYGITEGGGGGTFNLYPEDVLNKPGSIGKPTLGVMAKIVDADGKEVKQGEVGELIFSTNRMMKEYFKNPDMTEETLVDGWLYTGDLATVDEDGFFFIVDRKKDMITSGGENIYPVEIESALMDHPQIDDVACIGYPDMRSVEVVMAIVQLKKGAKLNEEEVIEYAKKKLSYYKVPKKVIFDNVMRNPTGKLMKPQMREKYTGRKEAFQKLF